ncbi:MAG: molybdopterin-dependent oxidoreductase, partial [Sulfolobales archaeon]
FFERNPPIDQLPEFRNLMSRWNISEEDLEDLKALLKEYTAENVSKISGVPKEILRKVAEIYVERSGVATDHKKHGIIQWAMGFTQHTNATLGVIRAAAITQLLLGNVGYPGGGTHPFRGHSNVQGATDVQGNGLGSLPGYVSPPINTLSIRVYQDWKLQGMPDAWNWEVPSWALENEPFRSISKPGKGEADLAKVLHIYNFYGWRRLEIVWGIFCGTIPPEDPLGGMVICDIPIGLGHSETTFPRAVLRGDIRAAIIFGENPVVTNPNVRLIAAALSSLDLLVVSDIFETETTWFADIVLPAASFAEKEGSRTNSNRVIQWSYKVIDPIGDSKPDYWIIVNLYRWLRRKGAILLPSNIAGINLEKVIFRRSDMFLEVYNRHIEPDASWDYSGGFGASTPVGSVEREVNPRLISKEINFSMLLYQGVYDPIRDEIRSMRRDTRIRGDDEIDGVFSRKFNVYKDWGFSWPQNVRFMYNYDSLLKYGGCVHVRASGKIWEVCGETGEWIDEYTGDYRPAYVPGHSFWEPRAFKRRLSGVSDLFGGLDVIRYIRSGEMIFRGGFVIEDNGIVKIIDYKGFSELTGMKYFWANDTIYWDKDTASFPAQVKRPFFPGSGWRVFKDRYQKIRERLAKYIRELGSYREAVAKIIEEDGGWYAGYDFRWPIHAEPAESPHEELAILYPTLAWINKFNLDILIGSIDIKGRAEKLYAIPKEIRDIDGELVVITSNRVTEHFHSGSMSRNIPYLAELVPEPFATISKSLAERIGISSGDYIEIYTARGILRLKAYVSHTKEEYIDIGGRYIPVVSITWFSGFSGMRKGPISNIIAPDALDVITLIQESKGWIGKVRRARHEDHRN